MWESLREKIMTELQECMSAEKIQKNDNTKTS